MDLTIEIAAARQREAARREQQAREQREQDAERRAERERRGRAALQDLLGAPFLALIVDFEQAPDPRDAWPALLYQERQFHYEYRDHAHNHREHFWVRDDGARQFFTAESHSSFAEQRRDQALLALAACAQLPPPTLHTEHDDEDY